MPQDTLAPYLGSQLDTNSADDLRTAPQVPWVPQLPPGARVIPEELYFSSLTSKDTGLPLIIRVLKQAPAAVPQLGAEYEVLQYNFRAQASYFHCFSLPASFRKGASLLQMSRSVTVTSSAVASWIMNWNNANTEVMSPVDLSEYTQRFQHLLIQ